MRSTFPAHADFYETVMLCSPSQVLLLQSPLFILQLDDVTNSDNHRNNNSRSTLVAEPSSTCSTVSR
ncbi:hypothetical protein L3Y34_004559 [Caenorhabditis briggsae]|uniref:Uncharacterized protein n=1 Tax=Caenorhabditis briggsae TaxID=6238 RepID=A0AAE9D739_CAEBR|nr:hypothetical protein L3Y34_004559 [Caenorhabditis briggsae]